MILLSSLFVANEAIQNMCFKPFHKQFAAYFEASSANIYRHNYMLQQLVTHVADLEATYV